MGNIFINEQRLRCQPLRRKVEYYETTGSLSVHTVSTPALQILID